MDETEEWIEMNFINFFSFQYLRVHLSYVRLEEDGLRTNSQDGQERSSTWSVYPREGTLLHFYPGELEGKLLNLVEIRMTHYRLEDTGAQPPGCFSLSPEMIMEQL